MPHLTISIPAYNDAESLPALVAEADATARQVTDDYEILIIEDGSKDDTRQVAEGLVAQNPRVRLVVHEVNLGFGPTIREAYLSPASEWVIFIPGDGQVPPGELVKLYRFTSDYDFIIGYRRLRADPFFRKFTSRVYNRLITRMAGRRIHDVNGSALVRRRALDHVDLRCDTAFIHAELLLEALRNGARLQEVRIDHRPREYGIASGNKVSVILGTIKDAIRYHFRRR